jgi:hypothetical protein
MDQRSRCRSLISISLMRLRVQPRCSTRHHHENLFPKSMAFQNRHYLKTTMLKGMQGLWIFTKLPLVINGILERRARIGRQRGYLNIPGLISCLRMITDIVYALKLCSHTKEETGECQKRRTKPRTRKEQGGMTRILRSRWRKYCETKDSNISEWG